MMKEENLLERLKKILLKKAKGYSYKEEIDEYETREESPKKSSQGVSEQLDFSSLNVDFKQVKRERKKTSVVLKRKKISSHYVPPDLAAIKLLIDYFVKAEDNEDFSKLTNEELDKLRETLIDQLKNI